ncbi:MAG: 2,3-diphosphoglycerate-dependent phosphoglycerate mutase [Vallitalea sp.]|jgi:2,3-bisphosphoglycerate-dependent phosphoglycerate mutase|nr:2,3-diphosphoglycerate-dependent phosphoglycerate mutase [Vallitalea sp.]
MELVIVRHGESLWNKENKFTGWTDVDLSSKGITEAEQAGEILKNGGYKFDIAYTSYLKRAVRTLNIILNQMDLHWIPVVKSWRLNERHYGALQGLNKSETAKKYGDEQVKLWRRSYDILPPLLTKNDSRCCKYELQYENISEEDMPLGESLEYTVNRVIPYWEERIYPLLKEDKKVIIVAHGNSLRALIKHIENLSNEEILELNIPTGIPLVYKLDKEMNILDKYYLGDQDAILQDIERVKNQSKISG